MCPSFFTCDANLDFIAGMLFSYCKADRAASAVKVAVEPVSKAKASISINMVYPMLWGERAVSTHAQVVSKGGRKGLTPTLHKAYAVVNVLGCPCLSPVRNVSGTVSIEDEVKVVHAIVSDCIVFAVLEYKGFC